VAEGNNLLGAKLSALRVLRLQQYSLLEFVSSLIARRNGAIFVSSLESMGVVSHFHVLPWWGHDRSSHNNMGLIHAQPSNHVIDFDPRM
jgi:hypothetical protein